MKKLILLLVFNSTIWAQSNDCEVNFTPIGLYDFPLGISKNKLLEDHAFLKLTEIDDDIKNLASYFYISEKENEKVKYYFNFKRGILVNTFFEIEGSIETFRELAKKLAETNSFINDTSFRKLYYFGTTEDCSKTFGIKMREDDYIIFGGIEYK